MQHHGGDVIGVEGAGQAVHLGVAETVEGEAGFPLLPRRVAAQGVAVGGGGVPQRARAQLAAFEDLGVAQGDRASRLAPDAEAQPADEVLAEVEDRPAAG